MKSARSFSRPSSVLLHLRIATVVILMSAAAAMALVAAKTSSPSLSGRSQARSSAERDTKFVRPKAFSNRFQTLLRIRNGGEGPFDGAAQEAYDNRAYPNRWIDHATAQKAGNAAAAIHSRAAANPTNAAMAVATQANWQQLGPFGVPADALVASESTSARAGTIYSGRATAIAISPKCNTSGNCKIFIGAAGGGIWQADNALASKLNWHPTSAGIPTNAIGSIAFDPTDPLGATLYAGTGEPNGSGDSEAGVGLFKSTDSGKTWRLVRGSTPVAAGRSIGAIAIDPANANHIFIGTAVARHGSSSVNGGRFTPPGSALVGLYESTDGGASFVPALILAQDSVNPSRANGGDFFRAGVSHVELYAASGETQVYASAFDYGIFRRSVTLDGDFGFHQIFASQFNGDPAASADFRTEFSLAPMGSKLRVYVGDGGVGNTPESGVVTGTEAQFFRIDNTNVPAATLFDGTSNVGWTQLSSGTNGTPGFGSFNYCTGQCSYDMPVYSPPGAPNVVYTGGAFQYGEIDNINGDVHRSNGRAIQRSGDAGVNFTDMTLDTTGISLHPDQHAIAAAPFNPNIVFIANDGGLWRLDGSFSNVSNQCSSRGISGADLVDCQHWLAKVPTTITSLNPGLATLQYQSLSVNAQNPRNDIMGGTQDNGTHAFKGKGNWFVTIFGDGGQSGINALDPNNRFHTFFDAQIDVNFHGTDERHWDWTSDPFFVGAAANEARSFYIPIIFDPVINQTIFTGLQHVWRTQDSGGFQGFLDQHCAELGGDLAFTGACGDWLAIGQDLSSTDFGSDKAPGQYVVAVRRAPSDTGTLWAGLRRGRVFVTSDADDAPSTVTFFRIDTSAQPTRFVSGIDIDQSNPNHAFISYSGYNAYAAASHTATGHVFEVRYNPGSHKAKWSGDLAGGDPSTGGLGDQPITGIAVDWHTGDVFVSTDFGVFVRKSGNTTWQPAGAGLPPVAVYGLTIDVNARVLYAATHGRSAWRLDLSP